MGRETAEAAPGNLADQRGGGKSPGWVARLWPDGKRFAFVLTHDVEGPEGLKKVQSLAELELSLGFRSSFNLVPENNSCVPDEIRHWLTGHGFEVGVHDLHHDGSLFASRKAFRREAPKKNQYLKKWNAVGFRSGFMLHNLDWTHDLNVLYDASTFDTDPFELQPDAVNTIFPFWVPNPQSSKLDVRRSMFHRILLIYRELVVIPQPSTLNQLATTLNPQPPTLNPPLRAVATLNSLVPWFRTSAFSSSFRSGPLTFGNENWTGLPREAEWRCWTSIRTMHASAAILRGRMSIHWLRTKSSSNG